MVQMGLPEVVDRPRPRPGPQRGLRWGWTAGMWRAYSVTAGAPRQGAMATSRKGMPHPLSRLPAPRSAPLALRDERVSHRRPHWRQPASWHARERDLHERRRELDDWSQDVLRCEATTVSGAHAVTAGGLGQFGHRQDAPTRPPLTGRMGALAPLGMPLATAVLSGARAEDGFSIPSSERIRTGWQPPGLFLVGAGQRRALETRAALARPQDVYLSPWPLTGATAEAREAWSTAGVRRGEADE